MRRTQDCISKCLRVLGLLSAISFLGVSEAAANTLVVDRGITAFDSSGAVTFDQSSISSVVLADFNTIQLTFFAPAGEEIFFNTSGLISMTFQYSNGQIDSAPAALCGEQFLNLQGAAPVFGGGSCGVGLAGQFFFAEPEWTTSAGTSFTALQLNLAVGSPPVEPASDLNYVPQVSPAEFAFTMEGATLQAVPGPTPEPSSMLLLGTGLLGLGPLARRRIRPAFAARLISACARRGTR